MRATPNNPFFDSEPGGRGAAPGPLTLVQAFINTREVERGWEEFADSNSLRSWLVRKGLLVDDGSIEEADLVLAKELREALRALIASNNGREVDGRAVETLNRAAERARLTIRFATDGGTALEPTAGGVHAALGRLLAAVQAGMEEGTWRRLKACRNAGCTWAFYDRSKNRSGRWCSMAVCGNRTKTHAYRQRRGNRGI